MVAGASWWSAFMTDRVSLYLSNMLFGLAGATNETAIQMSVSNYHMRTTNLEASSDNTSPLQIRDMFFVHQRGTANGVYFASVLAGSFLTPMAAGVQAVATGWRSSYITLAGVLTGLSVIFIFAFEETKFVPDPNAINAEVLSIHDAEAKDDVEHRPSVTSESAPTPRKRVVQNYMHAMRLLTPTDDSIRETAYAPVFAVWLPHVVFTSLQLASGICWLVVLASMISVIFSSPPYNFDPAAIGYMFGGPCVGTVFGTLYGGYFTDVIIVRLARRNKGIFEPEMRIYPYPVPAVLGAAGLMVFGITAERVSTLSREMFIVHWS